ncbi:hypothetical protein NN3_59920 [Nocardia neocaledoniensis NBRC 108232]|uniref:Transmembrane protein n=1 Tax=Nocardia neocaledoniensis TaxID=236511 RepID=A0A317P1Q7_9NOCA|nr:hypothetical protein [Nocardia neocaledoniensis]PWV81065.1 hypothetical protein DFR69_101401 [Nocardia neocaledoniensis]GEM34985.1 hypothetical protein NN3_59920 [Nocardia neocaledoniensis NBRC 108232]
MNTSWVRPTHRWSAIVFTAILVVTVLALALSGPQWFSYLPLIPLAALALSGLVMLVQVFRRGRATPATGAGRVRLVHRWSGIVFLVTVLATVVALSLPEPIVWVSYLPLIPLAGLLFSGLAMLAAPRLRARRQVAGA